MRDFDLEFTESRSLGATWALDVLWPRLGIGETMRRVLADRNLDESAERVLFALVAKRALAPLPKLAARWVSEDVTISGLPATSDEACYQAMDWLPARSRKPWRPRSLSASAYVPNQEVDLLVFDSMSHFETDQPQVVGVAVTRHGIPVRGLFRPGHHHRLGAGPAGAPNNLGSSAPARIMSVPPTAALLPQAADVICGWTAGTTTSSARSCGPVPPRRRPSLRRRGRGGARRGSLRQLAGHGGPAELRRAVRALPRPAGGRRDGAIRRRMLAHIEELIRDTDTLSSDMRGGKTTRVHALQARSSPVPAGYRQTGSSAST